MKRGVVSLVLLALAGPLAAQTAPFDMTAEKRADDPRVLQLGLPGRQRPDAMIRRHVLPDGETRLSGEMASRQWTVTLNAEAPRDAALHLGYENSVMVAPEVSRLRVFINGTAVGDVPVQSPSGTTDLALPIPDGVLHHGRNLITVDASQRHRTDCSVESTYQLWTDLNPQRTFLTFTDAAATRLAHPDDIRGIGLNGAGETRVAVVAPGLAEASVAEMLVALAQKVAVLVEAPHLSFEVSSGIGQDFHDAELGIVLGTHADLEGLALDLPGETAFAPIARFFDVPGRGPVFVVSGPTPQALRQALADWTSEPALAHGSAGVLQAAAVPELVSGGSVDFATLGMPTQQFSGRRYSREFSVQVPPDFYAQAYGEAKIMLDAAFAQDVQPGSRIDIYVNDRIATTVPIMDTGGGVLRQQPIRVSLRDMRPGANRIRLEAIMMTEADEACAPGTTASGDPRFGIFDTSRLVMPQFARIARRPDLAAFAAAGYPYGAEGDVIPLVLGARTGPSLAAAMNITGRMALASGHILAFDVIPSSVGLDEETALFVAPAAQILPATLGQVGVAAPDASPGAGGWVGNRPVPVAVASADAQSLVEWRDSLENSPVRKRLRDFSDTLQENFDLSLAALRLVPRAEEAYAPGEEDRILVAQAVNPAGNGTWTVVTAADEEALRAGTAAIGAAPVWADLGGRLSAYTASGQMVALPAASLQLVPTEPWSFANARLILTNWLSENALAYSLLLAVVGGLLGLATLALLSRIGRRS
jgi:cellulose synthase operon protein B